MMNRNSQRSIYAIRMRTLLYFILATCGTLILIYEPPVARAALSDGILSLDQQVLYDRALLYGSCAGYFSVIARIAELFDADQPRQSTEQKRDGWLLAGAISIYPEVVADAAVASEIVRARADEWARPYLNQLLERRLIAVKQLQELVDTVNRIYLDNCIPEHGRQEEILKKAWPFPPKY